jgi:NhaA family Na+:H+ antiporter
VIGKPFGIALFSFLAVTAGLCKLPEVKLENHYKCWILGGIGFTMSILLLYSAFDQVQSVMLNLLSYFRLLQV